MLQEQYTTLQALYQQLKEQKIQDLEGLLNEQVWMPTPGYVDGMCVCVCVCVCGKEPSSWDKRRRPEKRPTQ